MHDNKYIERNPLKCFSMPSLIGWRLTVFNVINQLKLEQNIENVLELLEIKEEQIKSALEYCSSQICKTDCTNCKFCDGCLLRVIQDGDTFDRNNYVEIVSDGVLCTKSLIDGSIFIGTLNELELEEGGYTTWEEAKKLLGTFF